jgi:hypothetical protein
MIKAHHQTKSIKRWLNANFIHGEYSLTNIQFQGEVMDFKANAERVTIENEWTFLSQYGLVLQFSSVKQNRKFCVEIVPLSPVVQLPFSLEIFNVNSYSSFEEYNRTNGIDNNEVKIVSTNIPIHAYEIYSVIHHGILEEDSHIQAFKENILAEVLTLKDPEDFVIEESDNGGEKEIYDINADHSIILYAGSLKIMISPLGISAAPIDRYWVVYGDYDYGLMANIKETYGPIPKTTPPP